MNLPGGIQVGTVTLMDCSRCGKPVSIPAGCVLRLPNLDRRLPYCHEVVEPKTGTVVRKGEPWE